MDYRVIFIILVIVAICVSCTNEKYEDGNFFYAPLSEADCENLSGDITGEIINISPDEVVRDNLLLMGSAFHSDGLAIRNILVESFQTTNMDFNFSNWEVTLPITFLRQFARAEGFEVDGTDTRQVALEVTGIDSCFKEDDVTSITLLVEMTEAAEE